MVLFASSIKSTQICGILLAEWQSLWGECLAADLAETIGGDCDTCMCTMLHLTHQGREREKLRAAKCVCCLQSVFIPYVVAIPNVTQKESWPRCYALLLASLLAHSDMSVCSIYTVEPLY